MEGKETLFRVVHCGLRVGAEPGVVLPDNACPFYRLDRGSQLVMPGCVLCRPSAVLSRDGDLRLLRPRCPLADGGRVVVELASEAKRGTS